MEQIDEEAPTNRHSSIVAPISDDRPAHKVIDEMIGSAFACQLMSSSIYSHLDEETQN